MYAVVNHLHLSMPIGPDVWERAEAELPRRMREVEGFQAFHVIQVADDHLILVIVADSAEVLDRIAGDVGGDWMRENIVRHLAEPPQRLVGKIVATSEG